MISAESNSNSDAREAKNVLKYDATAESFANVIAACKLTSPSKIIPSMSRARTANDRLETGFAVSICK